MTVMTPFRAACSKRFSAYSIDRGESLARSSSVTLVERGPPSFIARVDDELASIIPSRASAAKMFAACTCKLFALGLDGCRHLWALVATLEDAGLVRLPLCPEDFDLVPNHQAPPHGLPQPRRQLRRSMLPSAGGGPPAHRRRRGQ